jgi:hypothetical protein
MKECTQQADKVAERGEFASDPLTLRWVNHYSPFYRRCYVQITKVPNSVIPAQWVELYDAFEGTVIAMCTSPPFDVPSVCSIQEQVSCGACQAFVKDHMTR